MKLTGHDSLKFDSFLPMYNWIHPLSGIKSTRYRGSSAADVFYQVQESRSRAIYVHIPFCETICTFCPFVRAADQDSDIVDAYVNALVREIEIKGRISSLTSSPIGAVFFGGGTPSYLKPEQILKVGRALSNSFDLTTCREYSFELEVKSVTPDRVAALKEIGVTHARFGAQTFSSSFRRLFNLTATVEQVMAAAGLLRENFRHVSCDMLYGMHGQSVEDIAFDIDEACRLGLNNIDFYPINNLATQPKLHKEFRRAGKAPTSGLTKHYMGMFVRDALYAKGFLPHNGHGYVKVDQRELDRNPVVTDWYSFVYHEHTLGYPNYDLLGFGVNAISSFNRYAAFNTESKDLYIRSLENGVVPVRVTEHSEEIDACRPIALALPYHGEIQKSWVNWERLPPKAHERLDEAVRHGLIHETDDMYSLTRHGWDWYSNLIYYMLPCSEQFAIDQIIVAAMHDSKRDIETSGLDGIKLVEQVVKPPRVSSTSNG